MDTFRSFQKVQFCDRISTTPKSLHRTATVRIELQTVAVLWTLFKTAIYGRCAQVHTKIQHFANLFPTLGV